VRYSAGLPDHVVKIGHDRWSQFAILIGKPVHEDLKPDGQAGRLGPQDRSQPFPDLVADRAGVQTIDLQLV